MQSVKPWFYKRDPQDMDRETMSSLIEYLREEIECLKKELSASNTACEACDLMIDSLGAK